jgi:hypothetical protein
VHHVHVLRIDWFFYSVGYIAWSGSSIDIHTFTAKDLATDSCHRAIGKFPNLLRWSMCAFSSWDWNNVCLNVLDYVGKLVPHSIPGSLAGLPRTPTKVIYLYGMMWEQAGVSRKRTLMWDDVGISCPPWIVPLSPWVQGGIWTYLVSCVLPSFSS